MNTPDASIDLITTQAAPPAGGHYSQGVRHNGLLYVSGQLPVSLDDAVTSASAFETQAEQAISNLLAIVQAAGGNPSRLLKVTVYVVGIQNWPAFNAIYARMLGNARPARAIVPVPELHHGYLVEIDAIAAV